MSSVRGQACRLSRTAAAPARTSRYRTLDDKHSFRAKTAAAAPAVWHGRRGNSLPSQHLATGGGRAFSSSSSSFSDTTQLSASSSAQYGDASNRRRERVVILGSGWAGYSLLRRLSQDSSYLPVVVSPRPGFVFTPLLTDATGGNLNFSNIVEPVRSSTSTSTSTSTRSTMEYLQASAISIDFANKSVLCEPAVVKSRMTESPRCEGDERLSGSRTPGSRHWEQGELFRVPYDRLVIAVGATSKTFGTPGVRENALFFRDIGDARRVQRRIRECFELAALPTTPPQMREWLLHFAIVGAGPTGTELAASLRDLVFSETQRRQYPELRGTQARITLFDVAPKVLSAFDESLSKYAMDKMEKDGIQIKLSHHVRGLRWGAPGAEPPHQMDPKGCLTLDTQEDGEIGVGMCVWATGNAMNSFVRESLGKVDSFPSASVCMTKERSNNNNDDKKKHAAPSQSLPSAVPGSSRGWHVRKAPGSGALLVDGHLRVQLEENGHDGECAQVAVLEDVFALGDNAVIESGSPPATAQSATQEAKWLAERLLRRDLQQAPAFSFHDMGMLAYIGNERALMQVPLQAPPKDGSGSSSLQQSLPKGLKGHVAWFVWNSAYLSMGMSWRNRLHILFQWTTNRAFGRNISRY